MLPEEMKKEALQTMSEIAVEMDFGMMENVLKNLRQYRLSPSDEIIVQNIERKLNELDWDGIQDICEENLFKYAPKK